MFTSTSMTDINDDNGIKDETHPLVTQTEYKGDCSKQFWEGQHHLAEYSLRNISSRSFSPFEYTNPTIMYCLHHKRLISKPHKIEEKEEGTNSQAFVQAGANACGYCSTTGQQDAETQIGASHMNCPLKKLRDDWMQTRDPKQNGIKDAYSSARRFAPQVEQRAWYSYAIGAFTLGDVVRDSIKRINELPYASNEALEQFANDCLFRSRVNERTLNLSSNDSDEDQNCFFYCPKHHIVCDLVPYRIIAGYDKQCGFCYTNYEAQNHAEQIMIDTFTTQSNNVYQSGFVTKEELALFRLK